MGVIKAHARVGNVAHASLQVACGQSGSDPADRRSAGCRFRGDRLWRL